MFQLLTHTSIKYLAWKYPLSNPVMLWFKQTHKIAGWKN